MGMAALLLYLVLSGFHLYFCIKDRSSPRKITKALLMPALLFFYLTSAWSVSSLAVLAIAFGWVGDVLLLKGERKGFFIGGLVSFLAGHLCYGALMGFQIGALSGKHPLAVAAAALWAGVGIVAFRSLRGGLGGMKGPVIAYLLVIVGMALTASLVFLSSPGWGSGCLLLGGVLFVVSDYILARGAFLKKNRCTDFFVMLTYLAAQLLLVTGLCM